MAVLDRFVSVAALLVAAATSLGAQEAKPPECDAAQPGGGNSARANISVQLALKDQKANPAGAAKNLSAAVKLLDANDKDEVARAYVLGSALSLWLNQPGTGFSPKRSAVGFTSNPEATIDLPGAIDSLFKVVETSKPGCSYYTAFWRGGQQAYLDLVNNSINALNSDKLDSAQFYATQANKLYPGSPYGAMVLGNVANKRNNNADALKFWRAASTAAATDTAYRDVQRQMLGNMGSVYINTARDASTAKAAQVEAAKQAIEVYTQLMAIPGTKGSYQYGARQNLQAALLVAGDTAAAVKTYQELLSNPSAYEYQDLLNSAVTAARLNKSTDAAKLFEAVLVTNPNNRDALYNLGVMYLTTNQNEKVSPIVTRLVAVDPGNPENYLLAARAFVELTKAKKGTAAEKALNDSTVAWYAKGAQLPIDVTFSEFTAGEKQLEMAGSVLDRRDKAAAAASEAGGSRAARPAAARTPARAGAAGASAAPKAVTLKFEALDKAGAVLGSQSITTEALTPGKSAAFRVTIPAANAAAYRYSIAE